MKNKTEDMKAADNSTNEYTELPVDPELQDLISRAGEDHVEKILFDFLKQ